MSLDKNDVNKIAWLARLSLEEQDIPGYIQDLSNILNLVDRMSAVDTQGIVPLAHPLDLHARLRSDEVTETNQRDHFQKNAPAVEGGHYLVPKVIE
ncbi:MAG: Asp-tRNA(Asn)/Glu-tRNA(Gln) amidotransferase subunit GatC [Gammaproteobacteria bacterium]|jgi:aspartyl-tRNA(Asn)/glutamyl-tRNA(Gln) amidotransferase subunit C